MSAWKKYCKKITLALSLCMIILWAALGTGASIAWFTDTSGDVRNIFHVADFALAVSHRQQDGTYKPVESQTVVFDDGALYEPGYVQVVYLKLENKGDVPFKTRTAVSVVGSNVAENVYGEVFRLQDYLRFGILAAKDESELEQQLASRDMARAVANLPLQDYFAVGDELASGESIFIAMVVHMPESVGNAANYRGDTIPQVELGLIVKADQCQP